MWVSPLRALPHPWSLWAIYLLYSRIWFFSMENVVEPTAFKWYDVPKRKLGKHERILPNLRIPEFSLLFCWRQLIFSFASPLNHPRGGFGAPNRGELGGRALRALDSDKRASISSLLSGIWQTRGLFNHRKQAEVEFLSWAIHWKDQIWAAFEEMKKSGFFPLFFLFYQLKIKINSLKGKCLHHGKGIESSLLVKDA